MEKSLNLKLEQGYLIVSSKIKLPGFALRKLKNIGDRSEFISMEKKQTIDPFQLPD